MANKKCFTIAEVLITLAVIGVVAALTIPTLIAKINQIVSANRQTTIEARLLDGINRYSAMEDGLSKPYETTYDFLVGLSKFYKMSQICKADEIIKCVPYDKIYASDSDDSVSVSMLTNINAFMSKEAANNYLAPASFITAQGTPVIMAFKKDCVWDMGKAMRDIADSGCIAYMYDESGTRLPNKLGKDWIQHGLTINGFPIAIVGGYKIMEQAFSPETGLTNAECIEEKELNYGITRCGYVTNDIWAYSMKYCHDKGWRLPNEAESLAIVHGLFKDSSGNHPTGTSWTLNAYNIDTDIVNAIGLKNRSGDSITGSNYDVSFRTSVEYDYIQAWIKTRGFYKQGDSTDVFFGNNARDTIDNIQTLCITD